ncbi:isopentenyl-diphosphate Delta-isomerase [Streptomyces alanosinicus]|uniref:Isopentenyl-diphosphate Delta-isomerase n=1 Tax=Streptomyces alanosinicus TaxID=68171 RepID=A0A918YR83_9ACTN|nr:isopentenyl-diphosphate Delta-isomerase [Streptomyces alanosinicus]GHE12686.1 isopentenyl-diphosphate Delta-isomerase [Streptomyces alanosinicus]
MNLVHTDTPVATPASADAGILLELVTPDGRTVGTAGKLAAHQAPGALHRAFSVFLFDPSGRMLMQRRALTKYHSPGVWSNTCCGHPLPGERPEAAATRRTREELGLVPAPLHPAGTVVYHHPDPLTGLVEHEYNHLFVGHVGEEPTPDPAEVHATRLVTRDELTTLIEDGVCSAWLPTVLAGALPAIRRITPSGTW